MDRLDDILTMLDQILDTKEKRHLISGILMSAAMLFGRPGYNCCDTEHGG